MAAPDRTPLTPKEPARRVFAGRKGVSSVPGFPCNSPAVDRLASKQLRGDVRTARRNRKRLAAASAHIFQGALPTRPDGNVEPAGSRRTSAPQHARQLDVADAIVGGVAVVHPVLLHQNTTHAEMSGDRCDLSRLIRLDAVDRHQRVAALCQRFGDEELQLAGLIAAESEPAITIFPFRRQLDASAQMSTEPAKGLDRRRPKVNS